MIVKLDGVEATRGGVSVIKNEITAQLVATKNPDKLAPVNDQWSLVINVPLTREEHDELMHAAKA